MTVCAGCQRGIGPDEPSVVAVELIHEQDFGGEPSEVAEGATLYFHADHAPNDPGRYRVTPVH